MTDLNRLKNVRNCYGSLLIESQTSKNFTSQSYDCPQKVSESRPNFFRRNKTKYPNQEEIKMKGNQIRNQKIIEDNRFTTSIYL